MPITRGRRCHFHSKDKPDSSGLTSPHKIQQKKNWGDKRKKEFFMAATEVFSGEEFPNGSQTEVRDCRSSAELTRWGCRSEKSCQEKGV